jgi:hypothetical protein
MSIALTNKEVESTPAVRLRGHTGRHGEFMPLSEESVELDQEMPREAEKIPDWAALAALLGAVLSIVGFISACFTSSGFATLGLTIGLILVAVSMNAAEHALNAAEEN